MGDILPPLLLKPHYVQKPWGGRRLADLLGRDDLPEGSVGESWEVFDLLDQRHPAGCSVVDGGPHDGVRLRQVLGRPFPLLVKVLDASKDLSVQVHPDGSGGGPVKEEAWIALREGGRVALADWRDRSPLVDVGPGQWLDRLETVTLAGGAGDTPPSVIHVPGGTVHAILAGALLLEVQNPADVTWRLDDYGRPGLDGKPRTLHLEEAAAQLRRPTPQPQQLVDDRWYAEGGIGRLRGERFVLTLYAGGSVADLRAEALYFTAPADVASGDGTVRSVPAHRTVVVPSPPVSVRSMGWFAAFAS